ncbi:MAG: helix-turn-helix domain-containing protein [Deltaproteobacteria bacterium]|nr:helix-turn-helix domain-containing protein [Deltaproteobacteria bacterium]
MLTVPELAARLRIGRSSAYRLARRLMHAEIGGRLLVPEPAVDRYVERNLTEPEPWVTSPSASRMTAPSSTTPTTPTSTPDDESRNPSALETSRSPSSDSATSNWLRPIQPRTRQRPSTPP